MPFNIHSIYRIIFRFWRRERQRLFEERIKPASHELLLDVGGHPDTWVTRPQKVQRIDCLNVYPVPWNPDAAPGHRIATLVGDGCAMIFADGAYDIAYSNSVIEHVGDRERQAAFAREVRRVGRRLWVQTPAYECPIEPHFLAPFVHWLPIRIRRFVARYLTPWGWIERPNKRTLDALVSNTRLLTRRQMQELFPDCEIVVERLFGPIPKSYIAIRTGSE